MLMRFVIYIKAGAYLENVEVPRKKTNLMFLGDGIGKTVVKASRNVVDGWTTFRSATVGEFFFCPSFFFLFYYLKLDGERFEFLFPFMEFFIWFDGNVLQFDLKVFKLD